MCRSFDLSHIPLKYLTSSRLAVTTKKNGEPHIFPMNHHLENDLELSDIFKAVVAARGLFDEVSLRSGLTFLDKPYPQGVSNPIAIVIERSPRVLIRDLAAIVSIGHGQVAKKDIDDLLHIGNSTHTETVNVGYGSHGYQNIATG